jgi:hypothetical protein
MKVFVRIITIIFILLGLLIATSAYLTAGLVFLPLAIIITILLYIRPVWLKVIGADGSRKAMGVAARGVGFVLIFIGAVTMDSAMESTTTRPQEQLATDQTQISKPTVEVKRQSSVEDLIKDVRVDHQIKGVKIAIHATIARRLSRDEAEAVIRHLHRRVDHSYERSFFALFLDGNTHDAWATAQFEGASMRGLQHAILRDAEDAWRNMPKATCDRLIGEWLEESIGDQVRITICKRGGKHVCLHERPGQKPIEVPLKRLSDQRYQTQDGEGFIYAIHPTGQLQVFTAEGQVWTGKLRPFAECFK